MWGIVISYLCLEIAYLSGYGGGGIGCKKYKVFESIDSNLHTYSEVF